MGLRSGATASLKFLRQAIYRPVLAPLIRRLGMESYLRDLYWAVFLAILPEQRSTITGVTARFRVRSQAEYWRTQNFVGERPVLKDLLSELSAGDVFYDVGANIGLYSCFALNKVRNGHVVAFEPHPDTAERLRQNLSLNGDRYTIRECALADHEGTMNLAPPEGGNRPGTYRLQDSGSEVSLSVDVVRGDVLRQRESIPVPSVVKIDVEGAELDVIKGLNETLTTESCRLVYVEVHPAALAERDIARNAVETRLRDYGFEVSPLYNRDSEVFLKAVR